MNNEFPMIKIDGEQINPQNHIEPGSGLMLFIAFFIAIIGTLVGVLFTYGILLIVFLLYPLFAWYVHKKAMALIHGSGVIVNEYQFPEIHECVITFKERLGITKDISVYIVEDNVLNAMAVRYGKKNVILLTDDIVQGCLLSGNPQTLSFVIAHELAHISLNHNGLFHSWIGKHLKKLGRLDEYSADNVSSALIGDTQIVYHGLLLLGIGYALLPYVNHESILKQAKEVAENKYTKKAEKSLTHPLLFNRIYHVINKAQKSSSQI